MNRVAANIPAPQLILRGLRPTRPDGRSPAGFRGLDARSV